LRRKISLQNHAASDQGWVDPVQQYLESAPRNSNYPRSSPDLDPELHRLPLGIPSGVLGNNGWERGRVALSWSQEWV